MGSLRPRPVVLDTGALIAYERGDRRIVRLLELAERICVPAGVVGQAWRNPARQVRLGRLLSAPELEIQALDLEEARAAGHLCGATGTADVIDASVAIAAHARDAVIVTSDPADIKRLGPSLRLVSC